MKEPLNAFQFLEMLKQRSGKETNRFKDLSRYLEHKARDKGVPFGGQFELTPLCNFNCKMCYVHLNPEQMKGQAALTVETWKDLMHQAWEAGMCHANLSGGECLVYPGFEELFLYLHSLGVQVGVLTNAFLLNERWIDFFLEHKPEKIQITLYGWNEDVYERVTGQRAFDVVTENIRRAIDTGLPVSVSVTPSVFLGEDVFETIRLARSMCKTVLVNQCIFVPREETGRSMQRDNPETEMFMRICRLNNELNGVENTSIDEDKLPPYGGGKHECSKRGLRCGGGRSGFVVDWKGTLMPCNRMDMIHAYPLKEGFKRAWERINQEADNWPRVPECEGCPYDSVCNNCAANMLQYAEAGKQPVALCEQTKYFVANGVSQIPECE